MANESKNLDFADLYVGQTATHSVVIDESLIQAFAGLTGDYHPLHTDREYAIAHGFPDVLLHGVLLTSLSSKLIGMDLPGLKTILLGQTSEYIRPIFPGDVLAFRATITYLKKSLRLVTVKIEVTNQCNEIVSRQEFSVKLREDET
jgi:3-hydroxybutyryl-CoA dehydratase